MRISTFTTNKLDLEKITNSNVNDCLLNPNNMESFRSDDEVSDDEEYLVENTRKITEGKLLKHEDKLEDILEKNGNLKDKDKIKIIDDSYGYVDESAE